MKNKQRTVKRITRWKRDKKSRINRNFLIRVKEDSVKMDKLIDVFSEYEEISNQ